MIGIALWLTGSFEEAVPHLERAVRLYAPGSGNFTDLRYSQDHAVWALSILALVHWLLGHPDRAAEAAVRSLKWARSINHGMTTGFSLSFGSVLWGFFQEEPATGGTDADEALAFCVEHDIRSYIAWGQFYSGLAHVRHGEHHNGLELMRTGIAGTDKINQRNPSDGPPRAFRRGARISGEFEEALQVLSDALLAVDESGETLCEAELHRLAATCSGEAAQLKKRRSNSAERSKSRGLWEFRAATGLAELYVGSGRRSEAMAVLSPVCSWFAAHLDTAVGESAS